MGNHEGVGRGIEKEKRKKRKGVQHGMGSEEGISTIIKRTTVS